MATRTAAAAQTAIQPKALRVGLVAVTSTFTVGAGLSLSAGDVIQMVKVPAGATVVALSVGSNYSGDAAFTVGDGLVDNRYITLRSASVAMVPVYINAVRAPYTYSTDDTIDVDISLVSISTIGGSFFMTAIFSMDTGGL